ncbi:acyltransferase [Aquimarina longa]|uniref:acyltransferase n=1 Tax=Aquimarina longa TaxID=1080221 RepID=UPI000781E163|nr:acyltransferase family protein [Aquimarina longa]
MSLEKTTYTTEKQPLYWIDVLRTLATFAVIFLHTSGYLLGAFTTDSMEHWWVGNIYDGGVRFCVPIFFMISGALLLSRDYSLENFIKKRFMRLIPPFLFWSFVYIGYDLYHKMSDNDVVMGSVDTLIFIRDKLLHSSHVHLWFVYTLIGAYLFIPIIRKWIKNATSKEILYFLTLWVVVITFHYSFLHSYMPAIDTSYFSSFMCYMVFGYFLRNNTNQLLNNKSFALLLFILGNAITILGTYYISEQSGVFKEEFYYYLRINVVISAMGFFLFFKNLSIKEGWLLTFVCFISKHSYGIYLVHILITYLLAYIGIHTAIAHPAVSVPMVSIICLVVSALVISIMKKIKLGNIIAG